MLNREIARILIIDDDSNVILGLTNLLEDDYDVSSATSGSEGVNLYADGRHDVVILDMQMPSQDGYMTGDAIRELDRHVPIIVNTGHPKDYTEKDVEHQLEPFGYLIKGDYDPDNVILETTIRNAIKYRQATRALEEKHYDQVRDAYVREKGLRHKIEQQSQQLSLLQSSQMLADLAGTAAHDFSNRLGALANQLDVLQVAVESGRPEQVSKALGAARREKEALDDKVKKLRDLSSPVKDFKRQPLKLALNDVLDLYSSQLAVVDDITEDVEVVYSRQEMSNVYHNLLKNSLRAYEDCGTPIEERIVTVRTRTSDDGLIFEFEDRAGGIPEQDLERVFDSDFTTKAPGEGKGGLGLKSCQIIMAQHRGKIEIESDFVRGTTARLVLPLEDGGSEQE